MSFVNGAQSATIPLPFAPTTMTGMTSGQLVINNTDLTSAGAGQGVDDGDDLFTVFATAVDSSTGSFDGGSVLTTLLVDFGDIAQGSAGNTAPFEIFNIAGDPLFTADLLIGSVVSSGDDSVLTTDMLSGWTVAAGESHATFAIVDTNAPLGAYSATYTIAVSDENIPGALPGGTLTLNLAANIIAGGCAGDVNGDGVIDTADLGQLLGDFGNVGPGEPADLNGDGMVDTADLGLLLGEFGQSCN